MTTIAHVKQAMQPLLQRYDDLALIGRTVIIKPVHHFVRGVRIDRRLNARLFLPTVELYLTFSYAHPLGGFGKWIQDPSFGMADVSRPASVSNMIALIENEALPYLRSLTSFAKYEGYVSHIQNRDGYNYSDDVRLSIAIATGEFDCALRLFEQNTSFLSFAKEHIPTLHNALQEHSIYELSRILHGREKYVVADLNLMRIWEDTPFPFELPDRYSTGASR